MLPIKGTNEYRTPVCAILLGLALTACKLRSQEPPSPQQIVATIQQSGSIKPVISHLSLHTCPNGGSSATGDRIFAVVSTAELPAVALSELASLWRLTLDRCDSALLASWFDRALVSVLEANDPSARAHFLEFLPPDLSADSRVALWSAAEREPVGSLSRGQLASRAVRGGDAPQRIERTVEAFRNREMSSEWIYRESAVLLREDAELYLRTLASRAAVMDDARLATVLGSVNANVGHEVLGVESRALRVLRTAVEGRSGIPAALRELRGNHPASP